MQHQVLTVTPRVISQLLEAIVPKDGETLAQAVVRLRGERTAERLAKAEELAALNLKLQDDSPTVAAALGQPTRSAKDETRRADLAAKIASIAAAEGALTAAQHVADYRDKVAEVETLIGDYKMAVRGFATQLVKTGQVYAPVEHLAEQLRMALGHLRNHSIGAGPAAALLPVPMDSGALSMSGEWQDTFGSTAGPNASKLARWRSEYGTGLGL